MTDEALELFYEALLEDDAESLYERAPCGYLSTAPDGTIIKVNQTFLTWTGYEREALVGRRTFAQLLSPGGRIYHETHYAPMLQMQGTAREIALDIVRADGRRLPVLVNAVLDRDRYGAPRVIRTAVFDATDRREYERELVRAKERAERSEAEAKVLSRTLQQTLIPPAPPDIPGLDVSAAYRPAGAGTEVGGDFYDVFQIGPGDWAVTAGDVRGKGVEAAIVTALVRYTIRGAAVRHPNPCHVLETVNEVLLRHDTDRFCTAVFLRLRLRPDGGGWTASISSGGHPLPLLSRGGQPAELLGEPGTLLGAFDVSDCGDVEVVLASNDALLLYTDGVTEARRGREFFGERRLAEAMARSAGSAAALTDDILRAVVEFQGGDTRDDVVLVAVRVP